MKTKDRAPTLKDLMEAGVSVISVSQAGRIAGVGRNLAYELARNGDIPTLRLGHKLVVPVAKLAKMLGEGSD